MTATTARRPLPLEPRFVYGPIVSRRWGGRGPEPYCHPRQGSASFDCIVLHYGDTDVKVSKPGWGRPAHRVPPPGRCGQAVEGALRRVAQSIASPSREWRADLYPYFAGSRSSEAPADRYCPGPDHALLERNDAGCISAQAELHHTTARSQAGAARNDLRAGERPAAGVDFVGVVETLRGIGIYAPECSSTGR